MDFQDRSDFSDFKNTKMGSLLGLCSGRQPDEFAYAIQQWATNPSTRRTRSRLENYVRTRRRFKESSAAARNTKCRKTTRCGVYSNLEARGRKDEKETCSEKREARRYISIFVNTKCLEGRLSSPGLRTRTQTENLLLSGRIFVMGPEADFKGASNLQLLGRWCNLVEKWWGNRQATK